MLKKRLIFVLYFDSGSFFLSRNFRLQRVGDVRWLVDKFRFKSIGRFIDEIVILDVTRKLDSRRCADGPFADAVAYLMRETFVPLTIGGGIRDIEAAERCFAYGADKILLNSAAVTVPSFVRECVTRYGAQAVTGAVDVVNTGAGYVSKLNNGQQAGVPLEEHLEILAALQVGEVMVNSIDRDGTGTGLNRELIELCSSVSVPLIVAGGAGKPEHFAEVLAMPNVEAVATGNLFNFIGKGFELVRSYLLTQHLPVRNPAV